MLFDLRGSGRRRTVKIVYITLAFLMGGGLVLFGIGGGGGISGGLVDAITGTTGGSDTSANASASWRPLRSRGPGRTRRTRRHGRSSPARASSSPAPARTSTRRRAHSPRRASRSSQSAGDAWERYLALNPKNPDDRVASLMVQAFGALNKPDKAAEAQEVITQARPTAATFTQLAVYAYEAGQTRKGDLAKNKALELTPKDMREALKGQLEQAKQSAAIRGGPAERHPVASFYTSARPL